jgi:xylulose-5-phosphate/fructose-6-phosphate phosphoketolase
MHAAAGAWSRAGLRHQVSDDRLRPRALTREHGEDLPGVAEWA